MQVEIAPQTGKRVEPEGMDDELKMVALQSLFQSDPARAAGFVADILKPGSKASRELKETAVSLLGNYGGPEATSMLLEIARTQPDPELRAVAIHRLGQTNSETVIDELSKIYAAERDRDVKGQVLHAFAQMNSPRAYAALLEVARAGGDAELRETAIHWLGQRNEPQVFDDLMRLMSAERDDEMRGGILHAFAQMNDPRAQAKLSEVARTARQRRTSHAGDSLDRAAAGRHRHRRVDEHLPRRPKRRRTQRCAPRPLAAEQPARPRHAV